MNQKQGKGTPKLSNKGPSQGGVAQDNPPKLQAKNNTMKPKKDTRKCFEFHKSSTHNTSECRAKQSLVAELKAYESNACSDFESEPDKGNDRGKQIIDAEPNAIVATMKIQRRQSISSIPRCGYRVPHCSSLSIAGARRTSSR